MSHVHTLAEVAELVSAELEEVRELAERLASFRAAYDERTGKVTDHGRDLLVSWYTDDSLSFR